MIKILIKTLVVFVTIVSVLVTVFFALVPFLFGTLLGGWSSLTIIPMIVFFFVSVKSLGCLE